MLNANKRDVKIKCRKFRNNRKATGVINRKMEIIFLSVLKFLI